MLSQTEIDHYHENGYVIPDYSLDDHTLQDIKEKHSLFVKQHPEFADYCPAILPWLPEFVDIGRNPRILRMISQILGEDIALWNSSFFAKPPYVGSKTPWHQDGKYWAMRPLATCTVWIAIDDATIENGCLQVVRGSHQDQRVRHHELNTADGLALDLELVADEVDNTKIDYLEMKAGQMSLHDVYLVHGSEPNTSPNPRRGMTLRFMPTASHFDRYIEKQIFDARSPEGSDFQPLPVYLMQGIDQCELNDFVGDFTKAESISIL
ncbi:MAG: phytanoyl-CoA dioxygenase family protein [Gammaproteobacteria bacterium]|nr:phytanoyl-CoA dioxygenase family protein [Gammaproteobacteria bacterium]